MASVAANLGIHENLLRGWKRQLDEQSEGLGSDEREELKRLREESRRLKMEREILKKRRPSSQRKADEILHWHAAPVDLPFRQDLDKVWEQARLSAFPTHVHSLGIEAAQLIAMAVALCTPKVVFDRTRFFDELRSRIETRDLQIKLDLAAVARTGEDLIPLGNGIAT